MRYTKKLGRWRKVEEYINIYRRLRDDMRDAGMPEADFEELTLHAIVDGKSENEAWKAFETLLAMRPGAAYPKNIKELEEMMQIYAVKLIENTSDKAEWGMPFREKNSDRNWNEQENNGNRGNNPSRNNNDNFNKGNGGGDQATSGGNQAGRGRGNIMIRINSAIRRNENPQRWSWNKN